MDAGFGCFGLGISYENGNGVDQDYAKAIQLHDKACDLNEGRGCHNLGNIYLNGDAGTPDYAKASQYFSRACDLNNELS